MKRFWIILAVLLSITTLFWNTCVAAEPNILILVNSDNPLPDDFQPEELVNLYANKHSFRLARSDLFLERVAYEAANSLFKAAENDNMNGYTFTSCYRTREKQQEVYDASEPGIAQLPGYSEHETGLAFDVTVRRDSVEFEDTKQFKWLIEHCWDYGFILRYPEGKEDITGIPYESWHYRYVGKDAAKFIHEYDLTLEEYLQLYCNTDEIILQ